MSGNPLTISPDIRGLGLEASWEIAALLQVIVAQSPLRGDGDQSPLVVRGLALRAERLNSVLMSMLGNDLPDDPAELRQLKRQVMGEAAVPFHEGDAS